MAGIVCTITGIAFASAAALTTQGIYGIFFGKGLSVWYFLDQNQFLDNIQFFQCVNVYKKPFSVAIRLGLIIKFQERGREVFSLKIKDFTLPFAEDHQKGKRILADGNRQNGFAALPEFQFILSIANSIQTIMSAHENHSFMTDFFQHVHGRIHLKLCEKKKYRVQSRRAPRHPNQALWARKRKEQGEPENAEPAEPDRYRKGRDAANHLLPEDAAAWASVGALRGRGFLKGKL